MTKLQFIVRPASGARHEEFADLLHDGLIPALQRADSAQIKLTHTVSRAPRLSVIPFCRDPLAFISLWPLGDGELDPLPWVELFAPLADTLEGYGVEESTPVAYRRQWEDGVPTPGIGMLTLFRRRPGLDTAAFIQRWHGGHTPLSLEIHPLWNYIRNVVQEAVVPDSTAWEGLVEEHFQDSADLLNPLRFFGGPLKMVPNMARVARDVAGFLDMKSLQAYLVQELFIHSRPGASSAT